MRHRSVPRTGRKRNQWPLGSWSVTPTLEIHALQCHHGASTLTEDKLFATSTQ
ncbi:MAG: hypothetical protein Ct9H300mP32_6640 [Verrucomicrobiota bacterium]|nr:MAG: hypothetical protein Ct9H300mP32_6640 [Verrucomicrobiota bacterium]